jgi:hypothetical protein
VTTRTPTLPTASVVRLNQIVRYRITDTHPVDRPNEETAEDVAANTYRLNFNRLLVARMADEGMRAPALLHVSTILTNLVSKPKSGRAGTEL